MKRHLRAMIYIVYSIIKFSFIKLFHFRDFKFSLLNLFSPFTEIDLGRKSRLKIGQRVRAKSGTKIKVRNNALVEIGQESSFNHGCMIISYEKVVIGKNVQFGPNVLIYDHDHDYRIKEGLKNLIYKTSPVEIGNNVWIGANVIILRGTKIGDNCVVGAGCVIKGIYDKNLVIVGNREITVMKI